MNPERKELLNLRTPPARLNTEETAWYLGFAAHEVSILVRRKMIPVLGRPLAPNSRRWFASKVVLQLANDVDWLDKATRTVSRYWKERGTRDDFSDRAVGTQNQTSNGISSVRKTSKKPSVERVRQSALAGPLKIEKLTTKGTESL